MSPHTLKQLFIHMENTSVTKAFQKVEHVFGFVQFWKSLKS